MLPWCNNQITRHNHHMKNGISYCSLEHMDIGEEINQSDDYVRAESEDIYQLED